MSFPILTVSFGGEGTQYELFGKVGGGAIHLHRILFVSYPCDQRLL